MRKFKPANPLKIASALREKIAKQRGRAPSLPQQADPAPPAEDFESTMARAFPEHLRGTVSGCCDSMQDGHGTP